MGDAAEGGPEGGPEGSGPAQVCLCAVCPHAGCTCSAGPALVIKFIRCVLAPCMCMCARFTCMHVHVGERGALARKVCLGQPASATRWQVIDVAPSVLQAHCRCLCAMSVRARCVRTSNLQH